VLKEIASLDPVADCQRIVHLSTRYDFPWDTVRALEFALFRTYCVPSISALLNSTGEFNARAQKRYDDTDLIVSELMDWGYDSERGRRALRRMNQIHGRFEISNEDFLYVLSTFVFEPIRWNSLFGWRPLVEQERLGYFQFWREVGRRMGIREIPGDYAEFDRFNRDYERDHFRFTSENQRVGGTTVELFVSWYPRALAPLTRKGIYALLDDPLIQAFGFPPASPFARSFVPGLLRFRARVLRMLPAPRRPVLRTEIPHPTYPAGYTIEELGPPPAGRAVET
jgi:hypothetical protein